jgi:hypothetical protein
MVQFVREDEVVLAGQRAVGIADCQLPIVNCQSPIPWEVVVRAEVDEFPAVAGRERGSGRRYGPGVEEPLPGFDGLEHKVKLTALVEKVQYASVYGLPAMCWIIALPVGHGKQWNGAGSPAVDRANYPMRKVLTLRLPGLELPGNEQCDCAQQR